MAKSCDKDGSCVDEENAWNSLPEKVQPPPLPSPWFDRARLCTTCPLTIGFCRLSAFYCFSPHRIAASVSTASRPTVPRDTRMRATSVHAKMIDGASPSPPRILRRQGRVRTAPSAKDRERLGQKLPLPGALPESLQGPGRRRSPSRRGTSHPPAPRALTRTARRRPSRSRRGTRPPRRRRTRGARVRSTTDPARIRPGPGPDPARPVLV
jgi:hypothetical protein